MSSLFRVVLLIVGLGVASATAVAEESEYRLGAGDQVRITVFGQNDLSGDFTVGSTGAVSVPLVGNVPAGGATIRELASRIADKLQPDYLKNPRVSVEVLNYRPFYIIGEVNKPGSYPFVNGMTVINAVALAGGYTYRARANEVMVTRANDPSKQKQRAQQDTVVMPGDVIEVPERFF